VSPVGGATASPTATSTFTSPAAGTAHVSATLDSATATTPVTVSAPAAAPPAATPPATPAGPTVAFAVPADNATLIVGRAAGVTLDVGVPGGLGAATLSFNAREVCAFTAGFSCTFRPDRADAGRSATLVANVTDKQGRSVSAGRRVVVAGPVTRGWPIARVRDGAARVRVTCPVYGACAGRLSLRARINGRSRALGSARFSRSGRRGVVTVPLSSRGLRALAASGEHLDARVTIASNGMTLRRFLGLRPAL
jgi:hypothetical protein